MYCFLKIFQKYPFSFFFSLQEFIHNWSKRASSRFMSRYEQWPSYIGKVSSMTTPTVIVTIFFISRNNTLAFSTEIGNTTWRLLDLLFLVYHLSSSKGFSTARIWRMSCQTLELPNIFCYVFDQDIQKRGIQVIGESILT